MSPLPYWQQHRRDCSSKKRHSMRPVSGLPDQSAQEGAQSLTGKYAERPYMDAREPRGGVRSSTKRSAAASSLASRAAARLFSRWQ